MAGSGGGRRAPVMLMTGEFWAGSTGFGLAAGLRRLGWVVQEVDRGYYGAGRGRSLALRVASRLSAKASVSAFQDKIRRECGMLRPDALLSIKGVDLDRSLLQEVRAGGAKTVMYYPDLAFNHPGVDEAAFDCYDLFATTKTFQVDWLMQRLGSGVVEHVPHGYVDDVHIPVCSPPNATYGTHDVLYAGNHSAYKQDWLERLVRLNPGLDLAVMGNRWHEALVAIGVPPSRYFGEMLGVPYAQAIGAARINVAIHFGATNSTWQDLVSTRTFEIPACRGFMLHIDNEEVREYFEPGKEIDVFSTPEELDDKIRFYLAHPDLREKMIERAFTRCVPRYGYARRALEIHQAMIKHGLVDGGRFHDRGAP